MTHLLDANVLIDADRGYYPLDRVPEFWDWLLHQAESGRAKMPIEIYEEIVRGRGDLVEWVKQAKSVLLWPRESEPSVVQRAVAEGYAPDLREEELLKVGADPFLVAHALAAREKIVVVTTEVSKPARKRANRHLPDVCETFGIRCIDTFQMLRGLNFRTGWRRP